LVVGNNRRPAVKAVAAREATAELRPRRSKRLGSLAQVGCLFSPTTTGRGAPLWSRWRPLQTHPVRNREKIMNAAERPLAIVTGASSGIGFQLAQQCVDHGFDLLIAADEPAIAGAAGTLRRPGAEVEPLQVDLATREGVDQLYEATRGRPVAALLANAGRGLGDAFLNQGFDDVRHVIETNVTGTLYLIHKVGREMVNRRQGRILITGSIAGFMPGTFQAVYNGTKAFLDSFAYALRAELKDSGVTVTCLIPGATETDFFERADMVDTKVGSGKKQPPEEVAKAGFEAMMKGESDVVTGWGNKFWAAISHLLPSETLAEAHRKMAAPGSGKHA
jgi:uncharacterized protein